MILKLLASLLVVLVVLAYIVDTKRSDSPLGLDLWDYAGIAIGIYFIWRICSW